MSISPQNLPSVGTTQYSNYLWAWRSSTSTHEIYDLQTTPGSWANQAGGVYSIKVGKSGEPDYNTWTDDGSNNPIDITISGTAFSAVTENSDGTVSLYGNSGGTNLLLYVFTKPTTASWISSGPTVTSITVANEISSTRTFTVTHTGTLNSSDINYWINGNDITSLSSPNTPITNLQSTATGSTFDSYTLNRNGIHTIAIGSEYLSFYVSINIQASGSLTELNNAGLVLNFPTTETAWLELTGSGTESDGYDSVQLRSNGVMFRGTSTFNGSDRVEWLFVGTQYKSNVDPTLRGFFIETRTYLAYNNTWLQASEYIDPVAALESFGSPDVTILSGSGNHFTHFSFNFAQLAAQAPTTSNGGRKRRYPIISTNLFDRQKSIFSIGLTHKDETLF